MMSSRFRRMIAFLLYQRGVFSGRSSRVEHVGEVVRESKLSADLHAADVEDRAERQPDPDPRFQVFEQLRAHTEVHEELGALRAVQKARSATFEVRADDVSEW